MQRAERRLKAVLKKAQQSGISTDALARAEFARSLDAESRLIHVPLRFLLLVILLLVIATYYSPTPNCLLEMPVDSTKVFREAENCDMCSGVSHVEKVSNVSPSRFYELYVQTAKPVIVQDGTRDWSAVQTFDFGFFKALYLADADSRAECQFFPYKTEFQSLREALNMSEKRSKLDADSPSWYIGWSNCNDDVGKKLRKHYGKPYFLPDISENIALSWIFMGGPGEGAHMHVDNVQYPSWQAQLKGKKKWLLAPPPECIYSCQQLDVIVEPGEIFVLDTNRWYHRTHILPGEISITIGSEFD